MQLGVGVSPPANILTFRPGLTYLTLPNFMTLWLLRYELMSSELYSSLFLHRCKAMHAYEPTVHEHRWAPKHCYMSIVNVSLSVTRT